MDDEYYYGYAVFISVPSRGAIFLNKEVGMVSSEDIDFRPLSGSYIS